MILSREDIESIADGVILDFRIVTGVNSLFTPIEMLATDYLGLKVTFEKLSDDNRFCGVTAYDNTELLIDVDGSLRLIRIEKNQIILDSAFVELGKAHERGGKMRFTLAHEVAHQILFQIQSGEKKARLRKVYSKRVAHSLRQLKTAEDWNEWQANALGASLLMPRESVAIFMSGYKSSDHYIERADIWLLREYAYYIIEAFCECFHVSRSSATIRLRQLGYLKEGNVFEKAAVYA